MGYLIFIAIFVMLTTIAFVDQRRCLNALLLVGAFPLTFLIPDFVVLIGSGINPQAFLLLMIFFSLILLNLLSIRWLFRIAKLFPLWSLFVLYCLLSIFHGPSIVEGMGFVIKIVVPFLLVSALLAYVKTNKDIYSIEKSIVIIGFVLSLLGIFNLVTNGAYDSVVGKLKWGGSGILVPPYMSPANFSFMLIVPALLSMANYLEKRDVRWLISYLYFLCFVFFAFTRISMLGVLFGSMVVFGLMRRSYLITLLSPLLAISVAFFAIIFVPEIRERMFYSGNGFEFSGNDIDIVIENINTSGRTSLWRSALEYFESTQGLVGAGAGSTDYWLSIYSSASALHSEFLRIYIDLGYIGLILFSLALMELFFKPIFSHKIKKLDGKILKYIAWFGGGFSAYFVTLITDNSLNYVTEFSIYCFTPLALIYAASRERSILKLRHSLKITKINNSIVNR